MKTQEGSTKQTKKQNYYNRSCYSTKIYFLIFFFNVNFDVQHAKCYLVTFIFKNQENKYITLFLELACISLRYYNSNTN